MMPNAYSPRRPATRALALFLAIAPGLGLADGADVVDARIDCTADRVCDFHVTVEHVDEGVHHYAIVWQALDDQQRLVAQRFLTHPHVNEQPFTRSTTGVQIPPEVEWVTLRALDSRHGFLGRQMRVRLMFPPAD